MAYLSKDERRRSIVEAAAALVDRDGLAGVTARNVAAELGGSPGQVHHHFDSTDALAAEAWRHFADRSIEAYSEAARDLDRRTAIELFFQDLVEDGTSDWALSRWAEAGAHAQLRPAVAAAYVETLHRLTDLLAGMLAGGSARRSDREAAGRLLMTAVGLAGLSRLTDDGREWSRAVMRSAIRAEVGRPRASR